ncbi:MAG: CHAT domain-containing protein [Bacteroidota bacterium]
MLFTSLLSALLLLSIGHSQMEQLDAIIKSDTLETSVAKNQVNEYLLTHQGSDSLTFLYHEAAKWGYETGDMPAAIMWEKEAVRHAIAKRDTTAISKALYNLSIFYSTASDFYNSDKAVKRLVDIEKNSRLAGKAYRDLGTSCMDKGEFFQAERYFKASEDILLVDANRHYDLLKTYLQHMDLLLEFVDEEALRQVSSMFDSYDSLKRLGAREKPDMNCLYYSRKGKYYDGLGSMDSAIVFGEKEIALALEVGDLSFISNAYNNQGIRYRKNGDYQNSVITLRKVSRVTSYPVYVGAALNNLGDTYMAMGQKKQALSCYQRSIETFLGVAQNRLGEEQLDRVRYKAELVKALSSRAVFYQQQYLENADTSYLTKALADIRLADKVLGKLRTQSFEETSKLYWRQEAHDVYSEGIQIAFALGDIESYFYFIEKNKAILLLEDLTESEAIEIGGIPDSILTKGLMLKSLSESGEDQSMESYVAYSIFQDQMKRDFPVYTSLKETLPVLTIDETRTKLPLTEGQATLQYFVGKSNVYGLYLDQQTAQMFLVGPSDSIKLTVKELKSAYQKRIGNTLEMMQYRQNAFSLAKKLLPADLPEFQRLLIVEDGFLQGLSFESLVIDIDQEDPVDSYLIGRCEIAYAYSLSHLIRNNAVVRANNGQLLGMAPKTFRKGDLMALPNSEKELLEIASVFDSKVLLQEKASKASFLRNVALFDVIHLSTHANSGDENNSWIRFFNQQLTSNEIYASQCNASLIVLSACSTAAGEVVAGEGVMSLARAFFQAGAGSVLSTLWNVNDEVSSKIVTDFYKTLATGKSRSAALREAKLKYLAANSGSRLSPYFWSAFVLIGESGPMTLRKADTQSRSSWYWAMLVSTGLLGFLLFRQYRK